MSFIDDISSLFQLGRTGRKLHLRRADQSGGGDCSGTAAANQARIYLHGLLQAKAGERNFEDIADTIDGGDHQRVQHFICDAPWDESRVLDYVSAQADGLLGGSSASYLIGDESAFTKKGESSAGVARQYNGRLGKVDNCQVGVFVALAAGARVTLLEGQLYLPKVWCDDSVRCKKAKIPEENRVFRTKPQILLGMIRTQRARGARFNWVSVDGLYGNDPAFLRALNEDGETFVADVHSAQHIWVEDPKPFAPEPRGESPRSPRAKAIGKSIEASKFIAAQPAEKWTAFRRREGINGTLRGEFLHERIFVWDGVEKDAQHWHLIAWRPAEKPDEIKYVLSNARGDIASLDMARMSASRFWIERAFQDAKGAVGMGEYQMRSWVGWHRHMAMVMLAMLFMLRERLLVSEELPLLSAEDIVWILECYLPKPHISEAEIQKALARRHRRRQTDIDSKKRRNPSEIEDIL
jgi:SRSO17 transposase